MIFWCINNKTTIKCFIRIRKSFCKIELSIFDDDDFLNKPLTMIILSIYLEGSSIDDHMWSKSVSCLFRLILKGKCLYKTMCVERTEINKRTTIHGINTFCEIFKCGDILQVPIGRMLQFLKRFFLIFSISKKCI